MVVCHCHAINDRRIRDEVASGALDAAALAERCGAGSRCGSCVPVVEAIVAAAAESLVGIRRPALAASA